MNLISINCYYCISFFIIFPKFVLFNIYFLLWWLICWVEKKEKSNVKTRFRFFVINLGFTKGIFEKFSFFSLLTYRFLLKLRIVSNVFLMILISSRQLWDDFSDHFKSMDFVRIYSTNYVSSMFSHFYLLDANWRKNQYLLTPNNYAISINYPKKTTDLPLRVCEASDFCIMHSNNSMPVLKYLYRIIKSMF